jgi:hypothetical protein
LVAPNVINHGVIQARLGTVHLASGDTAVVDLYGNQIMGIAVSDQVRKQLLANSGTLATEGGTVALTAASGKQIVDSLVEVKGELKAPTISQQGGKIIIAADKAIKNGSSTVTVQAKLDVSGKDAGEKGGRVLITADKVKLQSGTRINASGNTGGGKVQVGGAYQGGGSTPTAKYTTVEKDVIIKADGVRNGDGGRVIIWADNDTSYKGHISAKGGAQGGNGGLAEVSGKVHLDFRGTVDLLAPRGETGTLLLDPTDIVISANADSAVTAVTPFQPNADNAASNLNVTTLQNALASANVTVQTRATGTQQGNITVDAPITWTASRTLTLNAHNNIIVNQPISGNSTLNFISNGDVFLNADISHSTAGAFNVNFQPKTASTTIGVAGGAGTINLSTTDLGHIQNSVDGIAFGITTGTGKIDLGTYNWSALLSLTSNTGLIEINGNQNTGSSALTITTRNLSVNGDLSGTGTLIIKPPDLSFITLGLAGGAGTLNLDTTELNHIKSGWGSVQIGDGSAEALTVDAYTWNTPIRLHNGSSALTIAGDQNLGSNNLTLVTTNLALNNDLTGTGRLTISNNSTSTLGIAGGTGAIQLPAASLDHIKPGWNAVQITSSGAITLNAYTWNTSLELVPNSVAAVTIAGNQNLGANNLTIQTNNLAMNADVTGSGTLTIMPVSLTTTIGLAGGAGTLNLDTTELNHIQAGWGNIRIGSLTDTGARAVNAYTWNAPLELRSNSGIFTIAGDQNMGANNLTFNIAHNPVINAGLIGTGTLTFYPNGAAGLTTGLAGASGIINLDATELGRIGTGWQGINFGRADSTASIIVNAYTWLNPVEFQTLSGQIRFAQAQNFGAHNVSIISDGDLRIDNTFTGTGNLVIQPQTTAGTIGLAGGAGTINLTTTELNQLTNGWNSITIGRNDGAGAFNANAYTWNDNLTLRNGSGLMTIAGAQNFGANTAIIESDNLTLSAALNGTGNLTLRPSDTTASIGLAGGAGTLNLASSELDFLGTGWSNVIFGQSTGTGAMTLNAYSNWKSPVTFTKDATNVTNAIVLAGNQGVADPAATFTFAGNTELSSDISITTDDGNITFSEALDGNGHSLSLDAGEVAITLDSTTDMDDLTLIAEAFTLNDTVAGSGVLTLKPTLVASTMTVGGGAGDIIISSAGLDNITDGWESLVLGRADGATISNYRAVWDDPVTFLSGNDFINEAAITTADTILVNVGGDIILNHAIAAQGANNAIVLSAGNDFTNSAGATALTASNGRWLVYSSDPANNTRDGLLPDASDFNKTLTMNVPATIGAGNRFIYGTSTIPTLTYKVDDGSIIAGEIFDGTGSLTFQNGLIGDDTLTNIGLTGAALFNTTYTTADTAGIYPGALTATVGTLATPLGYTFTLDPGDLTVDPVPLTPTPSPSSPVVPTPGPTTPLPEVPTHPSSSVPPSVVMPVNKNTLDLVRTVETVFQHMDLDNHGEVKIDSRGNTSREGTLFSDLLLILDNEQIKGNQPGKVVVDTENTEDQNQKEDDSE